MAIGRVRWDLIVFIISCLWYRVCNSRRVLIRYCSVTGSWAEPKIFLSNVYFVFWWSTYIAILEDLDANLDSRKVLTPEKHRVFISWRLSSWGVIMTPWNLNYLVHSKLSYPQWQCALFYPVSAHVWIGYTLYSLRLCGVFLEQSGGVKFVLV